jgi:hypothetical protein
MIADESTADQDRDLLTRVLQSMSAQISGEEPDGDVSYYDDPNDPEPEYLQFPGR